LVNELVSITKVEANLPKGERIIGIYETKVVSGDHPISVLGKDILEAINAT
jgi:hypothetical protein